MIELLRFRPELDSKVLEELLKARDIPFERYADIPKLGLIAYKDEVPVVLGFLREVEGGYAMMDSLITNPSIAPEIRNDMIDLLVTELIELAKQNKFKSIIAVSVDKNTIIRSQKHGFILLDHKLISLRLN